MPDLMPPINSLYAGRSVFITGGTGFVGKVSENMKIDLQKYISISVQFCHALLHFSSQNYEIIINFR